MRLAGTVVTPQDLGKDQRDRMYELMVAHFDQVSRLTFERDLAEKQWVVVLRDAQTGGIQGFSTLMADMSNRGLLDDTLVVVMGEFGRTPKVNKDAGRDHWGRAGSMLFAGAGVRGGKIVGATDKDGSFVTDRPVRPADVCYTVYAALGIDPRKQLLTPEGRPIEILSEGGLVEDLYT